MNKREEIEDDVLIAAIKYLDEIDVPTEGRMIMMMDEDGEIHCFSLEQLGEELWEKGGETMAYSIGEVAKMVRVSTVSLRSWEKQRLIPKPNRRPTNQREYTEQDILAIRNFLSQKNITK